MSSDSGLRVNTTSQDPHPEIPARSILTYGLVVSLVVSAAYLIHPSFIRSINNTAADAVLSFSRASTASGSVLIVDIDNRSLEKYGQWPWSRDLLAKLLQKIDAQGADSISLDLILAEPDRTSPGSPQSAQSRGRADKIEIAGMTQGGIDHDRYLAETLSKGPFVLGYEFLFNDDTRRQPCRLHPLNALWVNSKDVQQGMSGVVSARGVVCNRSLFSDTVSYSGFLNATLDSDGILRRVPLLVRYEDQLLPSLALASLLQSGKSTQVQIVERGNGLLNLVVGASVIPVDTQGNMTINFNNLSGDVRRVSAADLLDGQVSANSFTGSSVLVGLSASGLAKLYQTPGVQVHSDVDFQARLLENMRAGHIVARSAEFVLWETLAGLLAAVLICFAITRVEVFGSGVIGAVAIFGFWTGAVVLLRQSGYLFSPLLPTVLIAANFTVLTIAKSLKGQQQAREKADDALLLLKTSEHSLDAIIKSVPDIIFRVDTSGRITFIGPAISRYTDSPNKFVGTVIFDLVAPDDLGKAKYRLNEKRTGERATQGLELRLLLPHRHGGSMDEIGYFSVSAEGIYRGDTPGTSGFVGTQGIIRDITEQKKLEQKLLHAQKMEVIGNLAAGVAHDLNNVLCGMISYPELLLLELPNDSPQRQKILAIQETGQKAAAIVADLLTLARRGVRVPEVVNLNRIITDYLVSAECETARTFHPNITIETDLDSGLMNVMGSKVHLSKVIMNMLNNASEAMPAGGAIRLSSYNRHLETAQELYENVPAGEYVCVSVVDEGVGIAATDLQRVFEPFYSKKTMGRSGSGLGMTVIWATAKDYNGFIDLQSKEGEGTQITLYLPATREPVAANPRNRGLEDYLGTEHILVVDDRPEQVEVARKMLMKLGYKVSTAESGEAALESLRDNKPDLVVLDMIMPGGMDGLDTFKRILEIHPDQRVVIASGFSESERVKSAQQLGAGSYLQKPYTMETFGIAVRRELDRGHQLSRT